MDLEPECKDPRLYLVDLSIFPLVIFPMPGTWDQFCPRRVAFEMHYLQSLRPVDIRERANYTMV